MSPDVTVHSLVVPAKRRMGFRFPFRRKPATVRGLTVGELLDTAAAHPASATVVWAVVGLVPMPAHTTEADQRVLFDLLRLAVDADTPVAVVRLLKLSEAQLTDLLRSVVELTNPSDVDELFEPIEGSSSQSREEDLTEGAWSEPSVVLSKLALEMKAIVDEDTMAWTPGRLLYAQSVFAHRDYHRTRRELLTAAYAGRLAQADAKGWKNGLAELQKD